MSSLVSTRRPAEFTFPSSSAIMSKIYDNIEQVERSALRLCSDLRRHMDGEECLFVSQLSLTLVTAPASEVLLRVVPRFGPILRIGWKRTHSPTMRDVLKELEDKGTITLVRKIASAHYFSHNVSQVISITMYS